MKKANENSISLNKYISDSGRCSRREAEKLISAGRVSINDRVAKLGNRVSEGDEVVIDGESLGRKAKPTYIAFNKPVGIVCTTNLSTPDNIISFINHEERLFPIGRLDKDSEGLIFLTNDGDIVNKILRAGNQHEKEYIVKVNRPITARFIREMSEGVEILDTKTKPCEVTPIDKNTFKIVLVQGLNRQIRRMCKQLEYTVTGLARTRIMNVHLGKIKIGRWRKLTKVEMAGIHELIANSSNKPQAHRKPGKKKRPYNRPKPHQKTSQDSQRKTDEKKSPDKFRKSGPDSKKSSFKKYRSKKRK